MSLMTVDLFFRSRSSISMHALCPIDALSTRNCFKFVSTISIFTFYYGRPMLVSRHRKNPRQERVDAATFQIWKAPELPRSL